MAKKQEPVETVKAVRQNFRYHCHGCTRPVYYTETPEAGRNVTCPYCDKVQNTVSENFVEVTV
jgi:hypothetical protein